MEFDSLEKKQFAKSEKFLFYLVILKRTIPRGGMEIFAEFDL